MHPVHLLAAATLGLLFIGSGSPVQPAAVTHITVNAGRPLGIIPSTAMGLNASVYDGNLLDPAIPGLLHQAGVRVIRYPGGSEADAYHWETNSISSGASGYANPDNTFDHVIKVFGQIGAQAMITVNYGSNAAGTAGADPGEAAGWVRYANVTRRYGVKYWEIGNEVYGNGFYGTHWETDLHSLAADSARSGDPNLSPSTYGTNAATFIKAMKAADPSIKVGVVLAAPGSWPDEAVLGNSGTPAAWNSNVLSTACPHFDFVAVHWYPQDPGKESDAGLLHSPKGGITGRTSPISAMMSRLRSDISKYCPSRADQIQIMITEMNSVSFNPGKQTVSTVNALFLADGYMTWLENGAANVDWWQLHNGAVTGTNNSRSLYGSKKYGDYGVLSNGGGAEPPPNTPFPAYHGLQMLSKLGRPGDTMVSAGSDNRLVTVHAVKQAHGDLAILLLNKDPKASHRVSISTPGFVAASNSMIYTYGEKSKSISARKGRGTRAIHSLTLAPYSLTTIVLVPASGR